MCYRPRRLGQAGGHYFFSELRAMQTRQDVASALDISDRRLRFILYGRRDRIRYRMFEIPKRSGGVRIISAPPPALLWLQRKVYALLADRLKAKACAHGFLSGRSIVTNAQSHLQRRHVVNFDLKDFFPSIHLGRVRGVFESPPFSFGSGAAIVLAQICCRHDGLLPQGGATSPFISNLVCRGLDNDLMYFAKTHNLRYTRYADDLTFSTSRVTLPPDLIEFKDSLPRPAEPITHIIEQHGFSIKVAKTTHRTDRRRQEVTGLTVNHFPNVNRPFLRSIEGALHAWETYGLEAAQNRFEGDFRNGGGERIENVIRGKIAFVSMVRGKDDFLFRRLARRFNRRNGQPITIPTIQSTKPCGLTAPKTDWSTWIQRYGLQVFLLQVTLKTGDLACGTAFHVGGGLLATARHNLIDKTGQNLYEVSVRQSGEELGIQDWRGVIDLPPYANGQLAIDVGALKLISRPQEGRIPTQLRLPEIGEEVIALGYPTIPYRNTSLVAHIGTVEALPVALQTEQRCIQVSFQSGGGLSGGCLIDRGGFALGIMTENVFMGGGPGVPQRPYGQAVPMEYFDELINDGAALVAVSNESSTLADGTAEISRQQS